MTQNIHRSTAYCLHSRPYRETSAIVQLFTRDAGRISALAKGIKSVSRQRRHSLAVLQPFTPVQAAWRGKGELKNLVTIEPEGAALFLEGKALFAGLYLNELLSALLLEQQEHVELYQAYEISLRNLLDLESLEPTLRRFERLLLEQLGYGIAFNVVNEQGIHGGELMPSSIYRYAPESGFIEIISLNTGTQKNVFLGEHLCKIAADELDSPEVLRAAKSLMRQTLSIMLGNKVLNSRQLFI